MTRTSHGPSTATAELLVAVGDRKIGKGGKGKKGYTKSQVSYYVSYPFELLGLGRKLACCMGR